MKNYARLLAASALAAALIFTPAYAASTVDSAALSPTTYTDLGVGPWYITAVNNSIEVVFADSLPGTGVKGHPITPSGGVFNAATAQHVYARSLASVAFNTYARYSLTTAVGGGGGSSAVTQSTSPWVVSWSAQSVGLTGTLPAFAATPTVNFGTLNGAALDASIQAFPGTVAAGTAATKSVLHGCVYNSGTPSLTNGQQVAGQCDSSGNLKVNVAAGTNANGQTTMSASSPVTIASDQSAVAVKAASGAIASGAIASGAFASGSIAANAAASGAFPAGSVTDLAHGQSTMAGSVPVVIASNQSVGDPCTFQAKSNAAVSTATGTTALVAGVSAKKIYVCSILLVAPSAVSVSLSEGSGATCGTSNQAGVIGVATNGTAANGVPLAANAGFALGNGAGTVALTATAADYLCLFQSGTAQIAGNITYVQQ